MKKLLTLTLVGIMAFSLPVMAANSTHKPSGGGGSSKPKPAAETTYDSSQSQPEAVEASSVPATVVAAAEAEGKSVGEYMNNAVASVPGLTNVVPIGQGGHVIINGAPSNYTFSVLKPEKANVSSAKEYAETLEGTILNVVKIDAKVKNFQTATVNFYMKGVVAGQNIKVFQLVKGEWVEVDVVEIREDHVVVDMTSLGTLAFIEVPAK